ncbi:sodium- and chloride-dependent glycine transporter 2-like [Mercenaria mercenaria]|uniref:sodium- and chloride-dependent glycine transporter 2-like n=1 Tax=Mercenaria mercenaria TaxID=6596 RepID=UPI00234FAC61|nr:sodium- and chloride-dependent glycine transporter 2-like [Mercenaria mercenaria]XP_053374831.1 sodium- and chloride-dependent glycine transporter 2-like [Mercenaria mercenaria]XP_053374832.1 sodium- and chloride-dependent glycine transporter 2-like [Mercenaria mercenaria]
MDCCVCTSVLHYPTLFWCAHLTLASYRDRRYENVVRDAVVICTAIAGSSLLFLLMFSSIIGHLAMLRDVSVESLMRAIQIDMFIMFKEVPETLLALPLSTMWSIFYFLMLALMAFDTMLLLLESIVTAIIDEWPSLRKRKLVALAVVVISFICSLPTTTCGGVYLMRFLDTYCSQLSIFLLAVLQVIAVGVYRRAQTNVQSRFIQCVTLACFSVEVFFLIGMFAVLMLLGVTPWYGEYVYPKWSLILGQILGFCPALCVFLYCGYFLRRLCFR